MSDPNTQQSSHSLLTERYREQVRQLGSDIAELDKLGETFPATALCRPFTWLDVVEAEENSYFWHLSFVALSLRKTEEARVAVNTNPGRIGPTLVPHRLSLYAKGLLP